MPRLTITIRDDESDLEAKSYLEIMEDDEYAITAQVAKSLLGLLSEIGYGDFRMEEKDKLDHDQDQTDSIQKSAHPDNDYMKSEGLCAKCHGPMRKCARADCPSGWEH